MDTNDVLLIAGVVLIPAAILWGLFLMRARRQQKPAALLGIPLAMRPAPPDEVLEGPRLQRLQAAGLIATLATAIFIPAYWLPERERQEAFAEEYAHGAVERGEIIYNVPPELPEESDPQQFREAERGLALGQGCANCHGGVNKENPQESAAGGIGNPLFTDPATGKIVAYSAPPLNDVFQRWDEEVVRFTIERGRPGTDMPTWGVEFGGSMTEMMVDDVIAYLKSIQKPPPELSEGCRRPEPNDTACGKEIFEARCAVCHGPAGQGKEDMKREIESYDDPETLEEVERYPKWYQGLALWKGDVRHLSKNLHYLTIFNGRRFAFMPPFGEAPSQGIPVPPNPLTDAQIRAVMAYERTL